LYEAKYYNVHNYNNISILVNASTVWSGQYVTGCHMSPLSDCCVFTQTGDEVNAYRRGPFRLIYMFHI